MLFYTSILLFLAGLFLGDTQFIELHDLNGNPGIMPFTMGDAKLFDFYMTSSSFINLASYQQQVENLKTAWIDFKTTLGGSYQIHVNFIEQKFDVFKMKINGLLPGKSRIKRFWDTNINVHKTYNTYNYLNNEEYDKAIAQLKSGQTKMIENLNEHIMWSNTMEKNFNKKFDEVNDQIQSLTSRLGTQELLPKILEFDLTIDKINTFLGDLESAVFEAKKGFTHILAMDDDSLFQIIEEFGLSPDQMPFKFSRDNIKRFYDILETRVVAASTGIIFLFSFPIMKQESYKLYELYSVPVRNDQNFRTIIPKARYLLTDESGYILTNNECANLGDVYYCKEHNGFAKRGEMDCLEQVITQKMDYKNCRYTKVLVEEVYVEQISETFYMIVIPKMEEIRTKCRTNKIQTLAGTYLLDLPKGCSFSIDTSTFMNDEMEDPKRGMQPVIAHDVNWDALNPLNYSDSIILSDSISLNKLQHLRETTQPSNYNILIFTLLGILIFFQTIWIVLYLLKCIKIEFQREVTNEPKISLKNYPKLKEKGENTYIEM